MFCHRIVAMGRKMKLIVAVTGASGSIYARLLCECLSRSESVGEIALIVSDNGSRVAVFEDEAGWMADPRFTCYDCGDMFAPPASGSAGYDAMVVIPCSMGTAGRIAAGTSDNLICRAADVMLKERRRLILVPREAPMSTIHLQNLVRLSEAGAVVCPAAPSFYSRPVDIEAVCMTIVERVLSLLGIDAPHYEWNGTR